MEAYNSVIFTPYVNSETYHDTKCIICKEEYNLPNRSVLIRMYKNKKNYEYLAQFHKCDLPNCIRKHCSDIISLQLCRNGNCMDTYMKRVFDAHDNRRCFDFPKQD